MPRPQPSAVTRSVSSLFSSTLASDALSVLSTLPRSGRIAWRVRSRPCLAEPPAESPSTMKSSLSSRPGDVQSLSLPGSVRRPEVAVLRVTSCCAARLASRARAARMMRATIDSATVLLVLSQCSSAGRTCESTAAITSGLFSRSFVCPWNCGSCDEHAEHADEPFADVFGRERHALRRQVVRLDEVADGLAEPGAEAVLVRAAGAGRDAVDVAAHVLVGRLRPLQRQVEPDAALVALLRERERRFVHRRRRSARARIFFR